MKIKIRSLEDLINEYGITFDDYKNKCLKGIEPTFLIKEMAPICGKIHNVEIRDIRFTNTYLTIRDNYYMWDIPLSILEPVDRALVEAHIDNLKRGIDESKD